MTTSITVHEFAYIFHIVTYMYFEILVIVVDFTLTEHCKFKTIRILSLSYFIPRTSPIVFFPCHQTTFEPILGLMSVSPPHVQALMFYRGC